MKLKRNLFSRNVISLRNRLPHDRNLSALTPLSYNYIHKLRLTALALTVLRNGYCSKSLRKPVCTIVISALWNSVRLIFREVFKLK